MTFTTDQIFKPLPPRAKAVLLASAGTAVLFAAVAHAQEQDTGPQAPLRFRNDYFGYGLAVGPRATYTDNINLSPDAIKEDEVAGSVAANGSAIWSTNRITAIIDGSLDLSYLVDQSNVAVSQDIGAVGTITLAENLFYVDAAGSSSRQLAGANARFSRNINAGRAQRLNVHNIGLSPYLNRRFDDGSAVEVRYRVNQVFIEDGAINGQIFNNDSRTQEAIATYQTGERFDRVELGLTAYGNKTREYGSSAIEDFDFEQLTGVAEGQYALTERFALTGAVGYDEVDTTAPAQFIPSDRLSGLFWRAGFRARPGRRTDIRLEYGRRYDDDFIDANISYDLSNRLNFSASAGRSFRTRAQAVSTEYEALQRRTLDFVEQLRSGESAAAEDIIDALTRSNRQRFSAQNIGFGIANDANARLSALLGTRSTANLYGFYNDTDFSFRQITTYGGGLGATHQLSRRLSAFGDLFYRYVDSTIDPASCLVDPRLFGLDITLVGFDPAFECARLAAQEGVTNTVGGRIGASYRLARNVSSFAEFSHTQRFSENAFLEYGENTVTAGLQVEF
ncbi:MAG: hypothetical protein U5J99_10330 [Parvularculaceae bacterium]|nr:hypothetical protein [Parvularculaceae bacterium]